MKSFKNNTNRIGGCPFNNTLFTIQIVGKILEEGFEWKDLIDSYTRKNNRNESRHRGCYKKYFDGGGTDIFVYVCEDGIEIDQDYDCGGNLNTKFIEFGEKFEDAWDEAVDYVQELKRR